MVSAKFLGLWVDSRLSSTTQVEEISKKLSTSLFALRKMMTIGTHESAKAVYHGYFHSVMAYGVLVWGLSHQWRRVFTLQKKALRIIFEINSGESCRSVFKREKILTFPCVYIYEALKQMHGNTESQRRNGDMHSHNTRSRTDFTVPLHKKKIT